MWCNCLGAFLFTGVKSMTLRGEPLVLGVMTIRLHQETCSFTPTFSNTPRCTSRSRPIFTSCSQWIGTALGVIAAIGVACGSTYNLRGGAVSIRGNFCFSQQLKAELAYLFKIYCFNICKFSGDGSHGNSGISWGGKVLVGHLRVGSFPMPEFSHF